MPAAKEVREALHRAWESRAAELLIEGDNEEAVVLFRRLVRLRPEWPSAVCGLIKVLYRKGSFVEASSVCAAALLRHPGHGELTLQKGRLLARSGRLAEAAGVYRKACAAASGRLEPYFYLAETLQRLDKSDEMFKMLEQAEREVPANEPADIQASLERFRLSILSCDFDTAAARGESILDRTRALEHLEALRWPVFIEEFDLTYGSRRFHQAALSALGLFIRRRSNSPWGYYYRVIFLKSLEEKATRAGVGSLVLRRRIQGDLRRLTALAAPRYGWMMMESAKESLANLDFAAALKGFRLVEGASEPPSWYARCQIAEILACTGRVVRARREFSRAEKEVPKRELGNVLVWKGEFHLWMGEYRRALRCEKEGLRRGHQYAHCWMGGALLMLGRPGPALKALDRAVAVNPWDVEAKVWRAETLFRLGRLREALSQAEEAVLGGEIFYGKLLRALVRWALGDRKGGRRDYVDFPKSFKRYIRNRLGLLRSDKERIRGLEWMLDRSRGVRRSGPAFYPWQPRAVRS